MEKELFRVLGTRAEGSVRSNGSSDLRVGFSNLTVHEVVGGDKTVYKIVNIPSHKSNDDAIVVIGQVISTGSTNEPENVPDFNWQVSDVNAVTNTCKIAIHNPKLSGKLFSAQIYLVAIARD